MTAYDFAAEASRISTRPAVATRVAGALVNFYTAWKNRRAFYQLGEMTDFELADIGLTRADLHVAIDAPFGTDPTVRLRAIATDRVETAGNLVRRLG
jgi:uncharacterized protein YjiS (DUF1127 family)